LRDSKDRKDSRDNCSRYPVYTTNVFVVKINEALSVIDQVEKLIRNRDDWAMTK